MKTINVKVTHPQILKHCSKHRSERRFCKGRRKQCRSEWYGGTWATPPPPYHSLDNRKLPQQLSGC